jgi:hypothetical protein
MTDPRPLRLALETDLPQILVVVTAAHEKYLTRMDRPPPPFQRDYGDLIEAGTIWVVADPIVGLISLPRPVTPFMLTTWLCIPQFWAGTGRTLLEFAEQEGAPEQDQETCPVCERGDERNISIYEHLGYREVA